MRLSMILKIDSRNFFLNALKRTPPALLTVMLMRSSQVWDALRILTKKAQKEIRLENNHNPPVSKPNLMQVLPAGAVYIEMLMIKSSEEYAAGWPTISISIPLCCELFL